MTKPRHRDPMDELQQLLLFRPKVIDAAPSTLAGTEIARFRSVTILTTAETVMTTETESSLSHPTEYRRDLKPIFSDPTRCPKTVESIDPRVAWKKTVLQCVNDLGHTTGHRFENPSNRRKKSRNK